MEQLLTRSAHNKKIAGETNINKRSSFSLVPVAWQFLGAWLGVVVCILGRRHSLARFPSQHLSAAPQQGGQALGTLLFFVRASKSVYKLTTSRFYIWKGRHFKFLIFLVFKFSPSFFCVPIQQLISVFSSSHITSFISIYLPSSNSFLLSILNSHLHSYLFISSLKLHFSQLLPVPYFHLSLSPFPPFTWVVPTLTPFLSSFPFLVRDRKEEKDEGKRGNWRIKERPRVKGK